MLPRLCILTNGYYRRKLPPLLDWLQGRAEVDVRLERSTVLDSRRPPLEADGVFVKGDSDLLLALAGRAEARGIPVANTPDGIWNALHRFVHLSLGAKAGVRVAPFSLGASPDATPWDAWVTKNPVAAQYLRGFGRNPIRSGGPAPLPPPHLSAEFGDAPDLPNLYLNQAFVSSRWEYKVYVIGEALRCHRRLPTLMDPEKRGPREAIPAPPPLAQAASAVSKACGLSISSVDFLEQGGAFFLTDVNATPDYNHLSDGPELVGRLLLSLATER